MGPVAQNDPAATSRLTAATGLITQLTTFVTALTALVTAVAAVWSSFAAHQQSDVATAVARQAANATALQASLSVHAAPALAPATPAADAFFVQLATYTAKQCEIAKQEIESYHGALTPQPGLWRDPTDRYVIIGAALSDRGAAEAFQKAAQKLSQDPSQAGNDLANAIIRVAPPFKPLAACPPA